MELFKKKPKEEKSELAHSLPIQELPTEALNLTYNKLMDKYNQDKSETTQRQLVAISKILRERANGEHFQEVKEFYQAKGMTEKQWKSKTKEEKIKAQNLMNKYQQTEKAMKELTTSDESIEIEITTQKNLPKDATIIEPEEVTIETKNEVVMLPKGKPKKKGWLAKLNEPAFPKEKKTTTEKLLGKTKKKKKPFFPLFKDQLTPKEELEELEAVAEFEKQNKNESIEELVKTSKQLLEETEPSKLQEHIGKMAEKESRDEPEVEEHNAKMMKKKHNLFSDRKIFKKKPKEKDYFCSDCKHLAKNHKDGCNKCGCLNTPEAIIKEYELENPKQVEKMIEEPKDNTQATLVKMISETQKVREKKTEKKQGGGIKPQDINKPKPKLNPKQECTCEHFRSSHFEMSQFCTEKDCYCSEFKPYPHDHD